MPSSSVTLLNFSVKNLSRNNGHLTFGVVAEIGLSNSCKVISRKKKGFENIYIPKKRKMYKVEKEVDEQEEFNAKEEEVDF
jgi:hypothetical protein